MTHPSLANRPKIGQKSANLRTEKDRRSFSLWGSVFVQSRSSQKTLGPGGPWSKTEVRNIPNPKLVQTCPNMSKLISQNVAFNYEYGQKPQFGQSKSKIFWTCFDLDLDQCALNAISIFQKNVSKMLVVQQTISEAAIICKYTFNWVRMRGDICHFWISVNIKSNHLVNVLIH